MIEDKMANAATSDEDAYLRMAQQSYGIPQQMSLPPELHRMQERLRQELGDYDFVGHLPPFHSSYDAWHFFGRRRKGNAAQPGSSRPSSVRTRSEWEAGSTEDGREKTEWLIARIGNSTLRSEREFKMIQAIVKESDPECKHFTRPIAFFRLPGRQPGEHALGVGIYEAPGKNYLRESVNFGPNAYMGSPDYLQVKPNSQGLIPLLKFLDFAIGASEACEILHHGCEMVHGELRPDAFHFNVETNNVRLLCFGSGARSFEHGLSSAGWSSLMSERGVEHKLQFVAPEQTGRLPAEPDIRTDIYSLGIIFYTLLTGQAAFVGKLPLDIMQNLLSRRLSLASVLRSDVPEALCHIIQKMTNRSMDDRYNSVSGVKHDLHHLKKVLTEGDKEALANFKVGSQDISSFFSLPTNLVGREEQQKTILSIIETVAQRSTRGAPISRKGLISLSTGSSVLSAERTELLLMEDIVSDSTSSKSGFADRDGHTRESRLNSISETAPLDSVRGRTWPIDAAEESMVHSSRDDIETKPLETISSHDSRGSAYNETSYRSSSSFLLGSETGSLLRTAQKLKRKGKTELITIEGAAGHGKSSIIQSITPAARKHGYFTSSKFDQVRSAPFEPILKVMSSLFRQIFSEPDVNTPFHENIRTFIKPFWGVLYQSLDLPMWLLSTTSQGKGLNSTTAAQNGPIGTLPEKKSCAVHSTQEWLRHGGSTKSSRFVHIFLDVFRLLAVQKFICFCLDDLQFADVESLELLQMMVKAHIPVLIILTYRDKNLLDPLLLEMTVKATKIHLKAFTEEHTTLFVAETLHRPMEYTLPLVAVVQEKTQGNPFFVRELLDAAYRKKCIYYCWRCSQWEYNLDKLFEQFASPNAERFSSNDFIVRRMRDLPLDAQTLLSWAAIMGNSFSYNIMKRIMACECSKASPAGLIPASSLDPIAGLASVVSVFIIMPTDNEDRFKFSHDRYVAAASMLCEQFQREEMHYVIAVASMKHEPYDPVTKSINALFEQARHVCEAIEVIKIRAQYKTPYRDLLFQAAETARENGARALGLTFYNNCLKLLPEDPWASDSDDSSYSETLVLFTRAAEAHSQMNQYAESTRLLAEVIDKARDANDKTPAAIILCRAYEQQGQNENAFLCLVQALADLGVDVSSQAMDVSDDEFQRLLPLLDSKLKNLDMLNLDRSGIDRNTQSLGTLFTELLGTSYWIDPALFYAGTLKLIELFIDRGFFPQVSIALTFLANIAISRFHLVPLGLEFGRRALEIFEAFPDEPYLLARGHYLHVKILGHLRQDMKACLDQLQIALQAAYTTGDKIICLLGAGTIACYRIWASDNLAEVEAYITSISEEFPNWEDSVRGGGCLLAARQYVRGMQGKTYAMSSPDVMSENSYSSADYTRYVTSMAPNPDRVLTFYRCWQLDLLYRFGYYKEALALGDLILPTIDNIWCLRGAFYSYFFLALSIIAGLREQPDSPNREELLAKVTNYRTRIEIVSSSNPVNYYALLKLIDAEMADIKHEYGEVLRHYEAAINHAVLHGLFMEEAHALELYADWLSRRGASRPSRALVLDALSAYRRIGAFGKAKQMSERYEFLLYGTRSLSTVDVGTQTEPGEINNTTYPLDRITSHAGPQSSEKAVQEWLEPQGHAPMEPRTVTESSTRLLGGLSAVGLDMIDLTSILESSQLLSSELNVDRLLSKLVKIIVDSTGAELCGLVVEDDDGRWCVAATGTAKGFEVPHAGLPLDEIDDPVGKQVTLYVLRFKDQVYLRNLLEDERFANVPASWLERNPDGASVIALPILHGDNVLLGSLYCQAPPNTFTERTVTLLKLLVNQIAISIANALLFKQVEKVSGRNASMVEVQKQALTQARDAEKKAKIAESKAMEMVRLKDEAAKAKSMFLANVSHELRTPLNGVIGMSEMLKSTPLNKEQEEHADSIRVCADTLLSVINDILDFSKLEAGKMTVFSIPLSLTQTISEVVRALSYTNLERNLQTIEELELDSNLVVMGDPVRLHQILMNLMSNSYKFTAKGRVTVRAHVVSETTDEIQVTVSVADTGIGISEEAQKKLFLPFSQADSSTARSYGGTGLGLSICKAIIENVMKGRIWLESEYGVGTTVSFTLPFKKAKSPAAQGQPNGSSPAGREVDPMSIFTPPATEGDDESRRFVSLAGIPRDEVKVCIAEDNPINQKIAINFVKRLGFHCEAFGDGQQAVDALARASQEGHPFHLVLMDVQMPVLDGYNATREIRKHADPNVRDVLVIAMTASAIRGDREKCLEAGMNNYLAKPVRADTLKQMLESYLHQPVKAIPNLQEEADNLVNNAVSADSDDSATEQAEGRNGMAGAPRVHERSSALRAERPRSLMRETTIHLTPEEMATKSHAPTPSSDSKRESMDKVRRVDSLQRTPETKLDRKKR